MPQDSVVKDNFTHRRNITRYIMGEPLTHRFGGISIERR
jgi:hypothetical protein